MKGNFKYHAYQELIDAAHKQPSKTTRFRNRAEYRFPDQFKEEDFPRPIKYKTYQSMVDVFSNSSSHDHLATKARKKFPDQYNPNDFGIEERRTYPCSTGVLCHYCHKDIIAKKPEKYTRVIFNNKNGHNQFCNPECHQHYIQETKVTIYPRLLGTCDWCNSKIYVKKAEEYFQKRKRAKRLGFISCSIQHTRILKDPEGHKKRLLQKWEKTVRKISREISIVIKKRETQRRSEEYWKNKDRGLVPRFVINAIYPTTFPEYCCLYCKKEIQFNSLNHAYVKIWRYLKGKTKHIYCNEKCADNSLKKCRWCGVDITSDILSESMKLDSRDGYFCSRSCKQLQGNFERSIKKAGISDVWHISKTLHSELVKVFKETSKLEITLIKEAQNARRNNTQ